MHARHPLFATALLVLAISACMVSLFAPRSEANVFASDLQWSAPAVDANVGGATVNLSFRLNEDSTDTTVEIRRADNDALVRTLALGAKTRGQVTTAWDLKDGGGLAVTKNVEYYFKVTAKSAGYSGWTQISVDDDTGAKYYSGRGVAVNRDPASPWFGRIYVLNQTAGTTGGRTTPKGVYAVNADFTDAIAQGDTGILGNVAWTASTSSPYRITVGPEGKVYVFDWTNAPPVGNGGVWIAPADLSGSWTAILDPADCSDSVGDIFSTGAPSPPGIHGSISKGFIVGKGLNRVLYTTDEDLYPVGGELNWGRGSIWKYPIGPLNTRYQQPPQIFYDDSELNLNFNLASAIARDAAGNVYQTQNRSAGAESCLWKISPDGSTVLWRSLQVFGSPDPFLGNTGGLAIDDTRGRLAAAGSSIYVIDLSLNPTTLQKVGGGAVVWAVGNNSSLRYNQAFSSAYTQQTAPAAGVQVNDVMMANTSTAAGPPPTVNGYAVGNGGAIWAYSAFASWTADASPVTTNLNGVYALQAAPVQAWAVGDNGVVLTNLSGSWQIDVVGGSLTTNKLNDIDARNDTYDAVVIDLFAVGDGGTILRRLDATNTTTPTAWEVSVSGTTQNLNDVSAIAFAVPISTTTAFAVGNAGTILKTSDRGDTWVLQTSPTTGNLRAVSAPTALFAFAVGEGGVIIKTSDGGTTWTSVTSPTTSNLNGVFFRDNKTGWIVGDGGKLYRTVDGGSNWVAATGTGTDNLNSVWAMPFGNGTPRDVAFDAAGNLYEINNGTERLRVFSPPDGPNQFTTGSVSRFVPASGDASKPAAPVVTAPPTSYSGTQLSASWTATGTAYQYAIGVTADDQGDYVVGWTSNAGTSVTRTGLALQTGVKYFFYVRAMSANGVWSDVGVSAGTLVLAPTKIGQAKATTNDGGLVVFDGVVVTKSATGEFWVQESDRSAGIRVVSTYVPTVGNKLTFSGIMGTSGPERYVTVAPADVQDGGDCAAPACSDVPLGTVQRATGGRGVQDNDATAPDKTQSGIYNDGLLVKVWGLVTDSDFISKFYLDDGSDVLNDAGATIKGIKVDLSNSQVSGFPSQGNYLTVIGIVRLKLVGGNVIAVLEPRTDADLVTEL